MLQLQSEANAEKHRKMRLRENGLKVLEERERAKEAKVKAKQTELASEKAFIEKVASNKSDLPETGFLSSRFKDKKALSSMVCLTWRGRSMT